MNDYFKNYALLVFFSSFAIPAFAMESGNTTPDETKFIAKFALTYLPKKEVMSKNNLLLQQNEKDAQDWFNEGTKPENQPIDPLLAYFVKRGDNVPPINQFSFGSPGYQINSLHFKQLKQNNKTNIPKFHFEKQKGLPHKSPPVSTSELVSPVNGRKEALLPRMERQNCLIM